ncbi:MAG: CPBP family intramembrane metalloprotease [Candidatus Bathyarchaeota archaeon]|nr:CPBP family intramembrane metalloprotease [Candidatus Bathyarchaeota archaeon]
MTSENGLRVFLGSFLLLIISYLVYFARYPMWQFFTSVEPVFVILILSYSVVLVVALFLLKKDSKKSLSEVFTNNSSSTILIGMIFGSLYLGLWYLISFVLGSRFEFESFPSLRGYENYTVYSLPLAFSLYLAFSVFGAFAEEVAYRGYVQTRISSRFGYVVGIVVATLLFSLEHIHIFQPSWIVKFFETQFLHVLLFGIFVGYLFFKSKENIWSVFSFHALLNIFSVSVPIVVTTTFPFANQFAEIASFTAMILLLRFLPLRNKSLPAS